MKTNADNELIKSGKFECAKGQGTKAGQAGCFLKGATCADVDKSSIKLQFKFRVGDMFQNQDNFDNQYELALDIDNTAWVDDWDGTGAETEGKCWLPVFSHPDPNADELKLTS